VLHLVFSGAAVDQARYLGERPELPGPLAVTLSRRLLRLVEMQEYVVCEKSDGERAMMLLVPSVFRSVPVGAYLIDRTFEVHTFPRALEYAVLSGAAGPTLMDGELILRPHDYGTGTGNALYMIFDMIACNGAEAGRQHFDRRMEAIGNAVRAPFRAADEGLKAGGREMLPLYLSGKLFLPKASVRDIFACIHEEAAPPAACLVAPLENEVAGLSLDKISAAAAGPGGVAALLTGPAAPPPAVHRMYRNGYRVNGTDGIVFTPVRCSYLDQFSSGRSALPLLKWKFAEENTVDFRLRKGDLEDDDGGEGGGDATAAAFFGPGMAGGAGGGAPPRVRLVQLYLNAGGRAGEMGVARTVLLPAACDAYAAVMGRLGVDSLIVEAAYDAASSVWRVKRVRNRKTRANHVNTGWQTLEVIAENVTAEELVHRLTPPQRPKQLAGPAAAGPAAAGAAGGAHGPPGAGPAPGARTGAAGAGPVSNVASGSAAGVAAGAAAPGY
jgi:hypothetical protein